MGVLPMKRSSKSVVLILLSLLMFSTTAAAETKYVTEDLTITLRTGPGTDRKIIAFPAAGKALEVLTPGDEYTEVQMANGKQGWVLTRYLTDKEPAYLTLERLERRHAQVVEKYEALQQRASKLDTDGQGLATELAKTEKALNELTTAHETLKKESQEFLKLKASYQKALKDATDAKTRADQLDKELQQLYSSEINTGLLYGGGLIVLGFITGFIVKRPKRRAPLL
jgi:SH3 domain protein